MLRRALFPLTLLAASGCAASQLTPDQCIGTDWYGLGLAAGRQGEMIADAGGRFASCAEVGAPGDRAAYRAGYEEGLARYCTLDGVLEAAMRGQGDILRCPDATYAMEEAYAAADELRRARTELDAAGRAIESARADFRRAVAEADRLAAKIPRIDDAGRRQELRREVEEQRSRAFRAERAERDAVYTYERAQARLYEAERRLDRLRARLPDLRRLDAIERRDRAARSADDPAFPPLTEN